MVRIEVNKHAERIKEHVFHSFPYNMLVPNFKGPHADDCSGCIIEAELQILVDKIAELSPVEDILEELEEEKRKNAEFIEDRKDAFATAGIGEDNEKTLVDLIFDLVEEGNRSALLLRDVSNDLNEVTAKLNRK